MALSQNEWVTLKKIKTTGLPLRHASRATSGIVLSGTCYVCFLFSFFVVSFLSLI